MAKKKATSKKVKEAQEQTSSGGFPPSVGTGLRRAPVSSEISQPGVAVLHETEKTQPGAAVLHETEKTQPGVARPQAAVLHETVPSEKTCLSETSRAPANPSGPLGHLPLAGEEFQKREGRTQLFREKQF
jgi:hypothetical protein